MKILCLLLFVTVLHCALARPEGPREGSLGSIWEKIKVAERRPSLEERLSYYPEELLEDMEDDDVGVVSCDCDYHAGGCSISEAAPPGLACCCKYKGAWTCGGQLTRCKDQNSRYCKHPDRSIYSCLQGGGDCKGY